MKALTRVLLRTVLLQGDPDYRYLYLPFKQNLVTICTLLALVWVPTVS